jgi:hypothetical protein
MAIVAAVFLAGFWFEGYLTSSDRVLLRLAASIGRDLADLTPEDLRLNASAVEETAIEAHRTALTMGWGAAAVPVVAAFAGMPMPHVVVVVGLALLYELYLLSRHRHATEVVVLATTGELAREAHVLARQLSFRPTAAQRIAMFFGWRPRFEVEAPGEARQPKKRRQ